MTRLCDRGLLPLTDEGKALHRQTARRAARMNKVFLAPLDPVEQRVLMELMLRLVSAADRGDPHLRRYRKTRLPRRVV